ncbi:MAG: class I SAM-dependent methyltransferase [Actinomycetota bacterium]|nr:class I SAM-dependent methyltransferase [Actinomycetota bacterium]
MSDPIFSESRLAEIYDLIDPDRSDLDPYVAMVEANAARSVLDVGCGTGTFACLLASRGIDVVGLDPAGASLDVARGKPHAQKVRWIQGDARVLPRLQVDLATMTANVVQAFLTDEDWFATLQCVHAALGPGGLLVFETRDPARQAWLEWTPERTRSVTDVPAVGSVEAWCELTDVSGPLVSFRWTYVFEADGAVLTSDSTLRFRGRENIEESVHASGYVISDVRDAPDRPGRELVFVARAR